LATLNIQPDIADKTFAYQFAMHGSSTIEFDIQKDAMHLIAMEFH